MEERPDVDAWLAARQGALRRLAVVLAGDGADDADDLLQTTLAKVYLAWDRIADLDHVDAYARRVMVNTHRSTWRRVSRRREVATADVPETGVDAVEPDGGDARLWAAVRALPPRQRSALVLRYYEELTERETADVLGCSVGTVKSQTSRALVKLRAALGAELALEEADD